MSEKTMWREIRKLLKHHEDIHITRVESHHTALGTPDIDYCINGHAGALESKFTQSKNRGLVIRPSQVMWHTLRHRAKGTSWILAEVKLTSGPSEYLFIPGARARTLGGVRDIDVWREQSVHSTYALTSKDLIYYLQRFRE